jgi:hypothetical protein
MFGLIVFLFLLVLALLAPWFGVDSRDGKDWASPLDNRGPRASVPRERGRGPARLLRGIGARLAYAWEQQRLAHEALWRAQRPWLAEAEASQPKQQLRWRRGPSGRVRLVGWLLPPNTPPSPPPNPAPPWDRRVEQ